MGKSAKLWLLWAVSALVFGGVIAAGMVYGGPGRPHLLIGKTTSGHHQIELSCETCHTEAFGGKEILQNACVGCHAAELKAANDSHPIKKFRDPRNASRLEKLDATQCVACHTEHKPEVTHAMGVTLPNDYCALCHQDVGENRPSHKNLSFETCASAGCHNFHDNRALYEDFLEKHAEAPDHKLKAYLELVANPPEKEPSEAEPITVADKADAPSDKRGEHSVTSEWLASGHAKGGVNCSGCHAPEQETPEAIQAAWVDKPDHKVCATCHSQEVKTFTEGKHGMRLAEGVKSQVAGFFGVFKDKPLSPMKPSLARLEMSPKVAEHEIGCATCHGAHDANTQPAKVESCQSCHTDEHSKAYTGSPHHKLFEAEQSGKGEKGTGVSCATCHLPRFLHLDEETYDETLVVNHNQNFNLRPNEKMIRSVCMDCHGLGFSINALADPEAIKSNFSKRPSVHIESIDWVTKRLKAREAAKKRRDQQ
ncbi:MAG: cytochrome c3 family protein [Pseudomonadota bacterium]